MQFHFNFSTSFPFFLIIMRTDSLLRGGIFLAATVLAIRFNTRIRRQALSMQADTVPFVKYQGLGNDFILIDNRQSKDPIFTPTQAAKLCDRNFGIGGDGVIFAMPGENNCDYKMRIYNSDGSEPQMCGNGIRCMAKYLLELENKSELNTEQVYKIWTNAGEIVPTCTTDGMICVDMGKPMLVPAEVPTKLAATKDGIAVESPFEAGGASFKATCVSMGNPHAVGINSRFRHKIIRSKMTK